MTYLGDVVFRHVCTHKTRIRARRGYEPTDEAAMASIREELAAGVKGADRSVGGTIQNNSGLTQGPAGTFRGNLGVR